MCSCLYLCKGLCVCIFLRSPKAVVSDTRFWSFLPHLWAPMGNPFTPPELSLGKRASMLATVMIFLGRIRLVAIGTLYPHPLWCCFSHVFFWSFFPHFYMVMGNPTTQPQLLTTNVLILDFFLKMTIFPFLVIFPPFLHGHGRPHDPTKTFNIKCAVLGSYHSDIHEKKPCQIHYKYITPVI